MRLRTSATPTLAALSLASFLWPAVAPADTLLACGDVVDARAARRIGAHTIVVSGNEIARVAPGVVAAGANDTAIDLSAHTCMPGWIDLHVHLTGQESPKAELEGFKLNEADYALRGAHFAEKTLLAGFTTVRDLGAPPNTTVALRDALASGVARGPRLVAGGGVGTVGGHGDPSNGYRADLMRDVESRSEFVRDAASAREVVRRRYKQRFDWIKIAATGGVLSVAKSGHNPQWTEEEIRSVVETARDYGMRVAAHAHGAKGRSARFARGSPRSSTAPCSTTRRTS